jgi:hypothetical protein
MKTSTKLLLVGTLLTSVAFSGCDRGRTNNVIQKQIDSSRFRPKTEQIIQTKEKLKKDSTSMKIESTVNVKQTTVEHTITNIIVNERTTKLTINTVNKEDMADMRTVDYDLSQILDAIGVKFVPKYTQITSKQIGDDMIYAVVIPYSYGVILLKGARGKEELELKFELIQTEQICGNMSVGFDNENFIVNKDGKETLYPIN